LGCYWIIYGWQREEKKKHKKTRRVHIMRGGGPHKRCGRDWGNKVGEGGIIANIEKVVSEDNVR